MPYSGNEDLPSKVKDNLPSEAQRIWREIFNNAYQQYKDDGKATATAWAGLERTGWKKDESGKWHKEAKKAIEDGPFSMFIPITKMDIEKRLVYGVAADETPDKADEIFDYASSKPLFEKWSGEIEKNTDGKSKGNIRSMHSNIAAGKIQDIQFDDNTKSIPLCAKVVDDNEWKKCTEGVYTGFSIGGKYAKRWRDEAGKTRYTAAPTEISLVDLPCNPSATFQMVKANGMVETKPFQLRKSVAAEFQINEVADAYQELETNPFKGPGYKILDTYLDENRFVLMSDPDFDKIPKFYQVSYVKSNDGFTFSQPIEMEREFKIKKYEKGGNDMVDELEKKHDDTKEDPKHEAAESKKKENKEQEDDKFEEKDDKDMKDKKKVKKEDDEEEQEDEEDKKKAKKSAGEGDLIKNFEGLLDLAKAGATHSKSTIEKMQKIHHDIAEMGGACLCEKCGKIYKSEGKGNAEKSAPIEDLQKSVKPENIDKTESSELKKMADRFDALEKSLNGFKAENDTLLKKVTELENQPMPGGAILNGQAVVEKNLNGAKQQNTPNDIRKATIDEMLKSVRNPEDRQRLSMELAQMEMSKSLQAPTDFRK